MNRSVSRAWQAMRAITAALILLLACAASTAVAGPLEDGQAAFKREDYVAALKAWKPLADQGNADAEFHLGEMYANGHGVLLNHGRALKWYRKAAAQGNADAQDALGFMYKSGLGVPRAFAEAIKWFRLAADRGNASAQFNLGMLYASGDGVTKDPAEAAKWYRKAAEQGDATAQSFLGVMYALGDGVPQDPAEALKWYRKAAEQGNMSGQFYLGRMYALGDGVSQDNAEAMKWYRKAADQGHATAKAKLAELEAKGPSVAPRPVPPVEARIAAVPTVETPAASEPPIATPAPAVTAVLTPDQRRVALVIGNSAYAGGAALANPANDAEDVSDKLKSLGFDVVSGKDLTLQGFSDVHARFMAKLDGADVALVYYAGHAMQIDNENWLMPVDTRVDSLFAARTSNVSLQALVGEVETRAKVSLIFLDACRNNPMADTLKARLKAQNRNFAETRGLARISASSPNTLVVFATQPDAVAADGAGRNSPFTQAFLANVATPGVEIEVLMKRVTAAVKASTNDEQQPQRLSGLTTEFYFVPGQ